VLAVANPAAGKAQEEVLAEAVVALRALADVELVVPADTDELRAALELPGERQLVVLGGDGTLSACVTGLDALGRLGPDRPIGLVPLGTGNDVARALGLPLDDPAAAARASDRLIDNIESFTKATVLLDQI
jgi:diacylglycerol kinase family enzyme